MYSFDILIIGATFFGCAYAISSGMNTLIIESESCIGHDFVGCMNAKKFDCKRPYSALTKNFIENMAERGAVTRDGRVHLFPLSIAVADMLLAKQCSILIETAVISIIKYEDFFSVTIFNKDGFNEIRVKKIIDTRMQNDIQVYEYRKYLCGMLVGKGSITEFSDNDDVILLEGALEGEYILKLKVDYCHGWIEARNIFHSEFQRRAQNELSNWKIASIGSAFAFDFHQPVLYHKDEMDFAISTSYNNAFEAFEGGIICTLAQL